jgi:hypothetical protein
MCGAVVGLFPSKGEGVSDPWSQKGFEAGDFASSINVQIFLRSMI